MELPGITPEAAQRAVATFRAESSVDVERLTKQGRRTLDARGPVISIDVLRDEAVPSRESDVPCAILDVVVRQVTPSVRPDDVLSGLRVVAGLEPPVPPKVIRLAQGSLTAQGAIADPLDADRDEVVTGER